MLRDHIPMFWLSLYDHIISMIRLNQIYYVIGSHKYNQIMLCDHIPMIWLSSCDHILSLIRSNQIFYVMLSHKYAQIMLCDQYQSSDYQYVITKYIRYMQLRYAQNYVRWSHTDTHIMLSDQIPMFWLSVWYFIINSCPK